MADRTESQPQQTPREMQEEGLLFSETEVTNPGYPGALLMLSIPLTLVGVAGVLVSLLTVDPLGGALCAFTTLVPGVALIIKSVRARRAQKREPHICPECGYDRRGLTPDAKCPECGTLPTRVPGQESQEGRRAPFAPADKGAPE